MFQRKQDHVRLSASSRVHMISQGMQLFRQCFQVLVLAESRYWLKIYEYEVTWSHLWRMKNTIEFIGMKLLLVKNEISKFDSFKFIPLLENDDSYLISGT